MINVSSPYMAYQFGDGSAPLPHRFGMNWDLKGWKAVINKSTREVGREERRNSMRNKSLLGWYRCKEKPKYEMWYDGSLGGDLLFRARAQCLDVNARTYRWSESGERKCEKCDANVDETVMHVMLECSEYVEERMEMMEEVFCEGLNTGVPEGRTGVEKMVCCLGLNDECSVSGINAVKNFLERMWGKRRMQMFWQKL